LWTEPLVSFEGEFHRFDGLGLGQLPPEPIQIWFGCGSGEIPLRRAGQLADGWIPIPGPTEEAVARLREYAIQAGRDPASLGISAYVTADRQLTRQAEQMLAAGATELAVVAPPTLTWPEGLEAILDAASTLQTIRV
jgi:alkanesulfonate monooxygenase SsuD/methylene tetrahydromethanopterin reductase-like flavin-dependent oxidoreductase (luciferase family)